MALVTDRQLSAVTVNSKINKDVLGKRDNPQLRDHLILLNISMKNYFLEKTNMCNPQTFQFSENSI